MVEILPKVSIVLPTHNGAKYIRLSIDSCLCQTHENIELITVDDGSTDDTPEIIRDYKDPRMTYIRHETNRGLPDALNTGFASATGEYLTWTSDDNYYATEAIERMVSFSTRRNFPFVYCDFYTFDDQHPSNLKLIHLPDVPALERCNNIRACFLYSAKVREVIGDYDPETALAEDYDYWLRVSKVFPMCHLREALYFYRIHADSLYHSRLKEVRIADLLVRMKNGILDTGHATRMFIDIIASVRRDSRGPKAKRFFSTTRKVMALRNIILFNIHRILMSFVFSKKARIALAGFERGMISLSEAKALLEEMLDGRRA